MGFNQSKRQSLYSDKHGGVKVKIFYPQKTNFGPKMFFLVVVYFYIGVMDSCVKGASLPPDTTW